MIKHGNLIDFTLVFMVLLVRSLFINDRYANFSVTNKRENKTWSLNLNKVLNVNRIIARLMGPLYIPRASEFAGQISQSRNNNKFHPGIIHLEGEAWTDSDQDKYFPKYRAVFDQDKQKCETSVAE